MSYWEYFKDKHIGWIYLIGKNLKVFKYEIQIIQGILDFRWRDAYHQVEANIPKSSSWHISCAWEFESRTESLCYHLLYRFTLLNDQEHSRQRVVIISLSKCETETYLLDA